MISEQIKKAREQSQLTQTQLAQRLGITRSSVNAWEMGISVPSTQYIIEMSRMLHVSTDFLLDQNDRYTLDLSDLDESERITIVSMMRQMEKTHKLRRYLAFIYTDEPMVFQKIADEFEDFSMEELVP